MTREEIELLSMLAATRQDMSKEALDILKKELKEKKEEFKKDDSDKLLYNLLPSKELKQVVEVLTAGAKKYGIDNWKKCNDKTRYINALYRHLEAYRQGEKLDKEDNLHHLAHLACNALFLLYFENNDYPQDIGNECIF